MSCPVTIQTINGNECIGDSLPKIVGNFEELKDATCNLYSETEFLSGYASNLLTLINQLSTNMQNIGNYPYLEYAWVTTPNAAGQSIPANTITTLTINTEIADTGNFGSISSNQITLAAGTYQFKAEVKTCNSNTAAFGGDTFIANILGLYNVTTSSYVSRSQNSGGGLAVGSVQYAEPLGWLHTVCEGQFTISSSNTFKLTLLANDGNPSVTGAIQDLFTDSTVNADQRTTIKLWKVG